MIHTTQPHRLTVIYISNLLLSFHYFLIIYIHSSYLGMFFTASGLALLYIFGSVINLLIFINLPRILDKIGNHKFTLWAIVLEGVSIVGLILGTSWYFIGLSFILHHAVVSMILFGLDIFLEGATKNEAHTGTIRGIYLTLSNITLVFSPLILGLLLVDDNFWIVYLVSLLFLFPLFFTIKKYLKDAEYKTTEKVRFLKIFSEFNTRRDVHGILIAHLVLQFFYAWMVIYMPIFLHQYVGFSWQDIGVIFTIMLLPFMLFELPIGTLADKKYGEKEILILGFTIMAVATFSIPLLHTKILLAWAGLLFLTRVGASFVEITSESYFFKHVNEKNTGLISLFRMTKPIAYIIAPAVVVSTLYFFTIKNTPYGYIFSILGVLMLVGVRYGLKLKDTK